MAIRYKYVPITSTAGVRPRTGDVLTRNVVVDNTFIMVVKRGIIDAGPSVALNMVPAVPEVLTWQQRLSFSFSGVYGQERVLCLWTHTI
jgi:hypothetical protein